MAESPTTNRRSQKGTKGKRLQPMEDTVTPAALAATSTSIQDRQNLVEAVRRLNPAGLKTAPGAFWDVEGAIKTGVIDDSTVKQQLTIVENGVNYSARRFNDLKIGNEGLTKVLKKSLDELDEQKLIFENLDAMTKAETEESGRIESLKVESDQVEVDIARKMHYSRQLEHMLQRLIKNQLRFDAHMVGMQQTMSNIQKEAAEIRLLRKGLDIGLAKAVNVLEETKVCITSARKDREVMMAKRRQEIRNAELLQEWLRRRDEVKAALIVELRGDLTRDEENLLRSQITEKQEETKHLQKANEESTKKLQAMEDVFAQLKQVTGVSSLDDMLDKFSGQKTNKRELEAEVKEAEARLAAAKKVMQKREKEFQDLKSAGAGLAELSRDTTDKLDRDILLSRNDYKLTKAMTDRLSAVLLGLQQGSIGLLQRVGPHKDLADAGVFDLTKADDDQFWQSTLEALSTVEQVLAKMIESVSGTGGETQGASALKALAYDDDEEDSISHNPDKQSVTGSFEMTVGTNNIRVKSRRTQKELEAVRMREDEAVLTEKELSVNGSVAHTGSESSTTEDGDIRAITKSSSDQQLSAGMGDEVPSNRSVKRSSDRTTADALKKIELDKRQKRLQERMALGRSAAAADDGGIDGLATYKAQKAAAARLCTTRSLPTLPEGVKIRDDVMTKTKAFIAKLPDLA